jgi:hypothetical protein
VKKILFEIRVNKDGEGEGVPGRALTVRGVAHEDVGVAFVDPPNLDAPRYLRNPRTLRPESSQAIRYERLTAHIVAAHLSWREC